MSNQPLHVGIIDDGVNQNAFKQVGKLSHNIEITNNLKLKVKKRSNSSWKSHGSTCAAIVKKYAPECDLSSIKILSSFSKTGCQKQLIKALDWCLENKIDIVNVSLGSIDYRDYEVLRRAINKAVKNGLIIIAAGSNDNKVSYPAAFTNVIGVSCDLSRNLNEEELCYNHYSPLGTDFTASSLYPLEDSKDNLKVSSLCNSYAAPYITAKVVEIKAKYRQMGVEGIKSELVKMSVNYNSVDKCNLYYKNIDWVEQAIIINIGPDKSGSLIGKISQFNVLDILNYDLCSLKDIQYYINKNKSLFNNIDSVIFNLSQFNEAEIMSSVSLIEFVAELGKNIILIDENNPGIDFKLKKKREIKIWHSALCNKFYQDSKSYTPGDQPVILIYSYTDKSRLIDIGKGLVEFLRENGYHALGCSNLPAGITAGFEYVSLMSRYNKMDKIAVNQLALINELQQTDVMVYCAYLDNNQTEFIRDFDKAIDFDIKLALVDKMDERAENLFINDCSNPSLILSGLADIISLNDFPGFNKNMFVDGLDKKKLYNCLLSLLS